MIVAAQDLEKRAADFVTPEIVEHWEHRAEALIHLVMKARYADLVWDYARRAADKRPDFLLARTAIDSYVASVAD
ncbi:hypothetical protein [Rhizobium leguminosarum]|uniref:Uncharacterized protein n=1 Tax=Rhizobium leguminosarum TaxID=384 RepID=A0A7K3VHM5_RHILE|nr:hypothetical protein [Rhizobium leguminosarum]NEK16669.1 hypothetical protein [Rhizobium leguminosarum]